ncbi:MAG: hypothetical protein H0W48_08330 [Methylibium sp.]|nr:hypothetical protein [Methylibium sp.]MBA3624442.1 hypothetical protein [Methylibium sp.]
MSGRLSLVLTSDEIALIDRTIAQFEIGGCIRRLLASAAPARGGKRITATDAEFDELLGALWSEVRGFQRLDEESEGHELDEPVAGSMTDRLTRIYDKIERLLS